MRLLTIRLCSALLCSNSYGSNYKNGINGKVIILYVTIDEYNKKFTSTEEDDH